jgi:hypothetical protein
MKKIWLSAIATAFLFIGCSGIDMARRDAGSSKPGKPIEKPSDLPDVWYTCELNPQKKGCSGVWTRRSGTNTFDARWQCVGGIVSDVVELRSIDGNDILVYRTSERDNYHLKLSSDKTSIVSGKIPWAPDWSFRGSFASPIEKCSSEADPTGPNSKNPVPVDFKGKWEMQPDRDRVLELTESGGVFHGTLFALDHNNVGIPVYDLVVSKTEGTVSFKAEIPRGKIDKFVESYNGKWSVKDQRFEFKVTRSYIPKDTYDWWAVRPR